MAHVIVPRKRGLHFSVSEKQIIINLTNYHLNRRGNDSLSNIITLVAEMSGVSERSIYKVRQEYATPTGLQQPKKKPKTGKIASSRENKYDEREKSGIRRIVHQFFRENTPPTINSVLATVNAAEHLPNFSRSTLYRFSTITIQSRLLHVQI